MLWIDLTKNLFCVDRKMKKSDFFIFLIAQSNFFVKRSTALKTKNLFGRKNRVSPWITPFLSMNFKLIYMRVKPTILLAGTWFLFLPKSTVNLTRNGGRKEKKVLKYANIPRLEWSRCFLRQTNIYVYYVTCCQRGKRFFSQNIRSFY